MRDRRYWRSDDPEFSAYRDFVDDGWRILADEKPRRYSGVKLKSDAPKRTKGTGESHDPGKQPGGPKPLILGPDGKPRIWNPSRGRYEPVPDPDLNSDPPQDPQPMPGGRRG